MGIYTAEGTRVTKDNFPKEAGDPLDVPYVVTEDLYYTEPYAEHDPKPEGSFHKLLCREGTVMTLRQINALFEAATVTGISPAEGDVAGGTEVTITGTNLDGVTAVKFDGNEGTDLKVVSSTKLTVKTPAGSAGAVDVVVEDDANTITVEGGFTYTESD